MKTTRKSLLLCLLLSAACLLPAGCQLSLTGEQQEPPPKTTSSKSERTDTRKDSDTAVTSKGSPKKPSDPDESSSAAPEEDPEGLREIECLLRKKEALKAEKYFSKTAGYVSTYFYNDAVIKDFNRDGHYEMVVSYVSPFGMDSTLFESYDPEKEAFLHWVSVYELYTVLGNEAVGSGYLDDLKTIYAGPSV